jgi:D,D-heptose 1,7-bisphosphate phosphatase
MSCQQRKAVFIDKDGTLIPDIPYNVNVDLIEIRKDVIDGLQLLQKEGFLLIVISNQSGVARGYFKEEELNTVWERISSLLLPHHLVIDGFYYCPHHPGGRVKQFAIECECRKPSPGLLLKASNDHKVDLSQSWMIGDILNDVEAGKRAGCRTILMDNGNETEWIQNEWRTPDFTVTDFYEAASIILANPEKTMTSYERVERL